MVVGYDRPLDWFFATVYNAAAPTVENEDDVADLWETESLEELRTFCAPYAAVGDDVLRELADEQVNRATHPMHKYVDHRQ